MTDFLAAVDRVAKSGSALDLYVVGQLLHRSQGRRGLADLTEREHAVLRPIAQGLTNAGVAKRLFLSERAVEAHVRRLLSKLDIADSDDTHRRVLAVLTYLRAAETGPVTWDSNIPYSGRGNPGLRSTSDLIRVRSWAGVVYVGHRVRAGAHVHPQPAASNLGTGLCRWGLKPPCVRGGT